MTELRRAPSGDVAVPRDGLEAQITEGVAGSPWAGAPCHIPPEICLLMSGLLFINSRTLVTRAESEAGTRGQKIRYD